MSNRPDLDKAIGILQGGGLNITGGKYAPKHPKPQTHDELEDLLKELIEKEYQLRLEHNHSDMRWYAYYARKGSTVQLFDLDEHYNCSGSTPTEAAQSLKSTKDTAFNKLGDK
jgi:hypothetical protein